MFTFSPAKLQTDMRRSSWSPRGRHEPSHKVIKFLLNIQLLRRCGEDANSGEACGHWPPHTLIPVVVNKNPLSSLAKASLLSPTCQLPTLKPLLYTIFL